MPVLVVGWRAGRRCRSCQGALGCQVDWKPNHIGTQSTVPALPLAGVLGVRGHQGAGRGVGVSGVHCGLAGSVGVQGPAGGIGTSRNVGASGGVGASRGCRVSEASRECRGIGVAGGLRTQPHWDPVHSPSTPTSRGVGVPWSIRGLAGGVGGVRGALGAGRECRDSGPAGS